MKTWQGWAYLATVIDLYSRKVVGWAVADDMRTELVTQALHMALTHRRPPAGVVDLDVHDPSIAPAGAQQENPPLGQRHEPRHCCRQRLPATAHCQRQALAVEESPEGARRNQSWCPMGSRRRLGRVTRIQRAPATHRLRLRLMYTK